jgi:hypothetical protein
MYVEYLTEIVGIKRRVRDRNDTFYIDDLAGGLIWRLVLAMCA